jgi:hypothetical protein
MWVKSKSTTAGVIKDKEYKLVQIIRSESTDTTWYQIIDELHRETYYSEKLFYSLSEKRDLIITDLLKI